MGIKIERRKMLLIYFSAFDLSANQLDASKRIRK